MHRPIAGIWDVPVSGQWTALAAAAAFFFAGGLVGCLAISSVGGSGLDSLTAYLQGFLTSIQGGSALVPSVLPLIWEVLRWPLLTVLLGFTALGLVGIPVLFAVRGFLLAFSISAFVRMFGGVGGLLAFLLFGVTGLISIPVLFILGVQSLAAGRTLASRFLGENRRSACYGKDYFIRCGWCSAALCVCILLEYFAVPALVAGAAGALVIP